MSGQYEFDPADRITAAAVGEPGSRAFYIQVRSGDTLVSMLLEKGQVALLSTHIDELLDRVGQPTTEATPDVDSLDLDEPVVADFRIGRIGLGYDEDRDLVLLQCDEYIPEAEEGEDEPEVALDPEDGGRVRIWATRGQMLALARRAEREVAGGRPICPMCGEAMDPEGHVCPRSNGHREVTRLA